MELNVQFADATEAVVISYFGAPQGSTVYQNLGTLDSSDRRWKEYYEAQPTQNQQFLPVPD
ncbi:hypothetical protein [Burkholderia diffusa]|uniref:hypothetical protein n=1 Tax=Burkholderia diffusa TaxID=488732 RepID=UPI00158C3FE8|nr:hypothetical protein [Burkholderia diffusa]